MKGIIFTVFVEFVETHWSEAIANTLLDESPLPSGGAYTTVGTYKAEELSLLVAKLSRLVNEDAASLVERFGLHLAGVFINRHAEFFLEVKCTFELLKRVENHIHREVKKLYRDPELPRFEYSQETPETLSLLYTSERALGDLVAGLIQGCAAHYGETIVIERTPLNDAGTRELFQLRKRPDE